jgi:23S rRNA pseudouridine1911/1915/1917 synthase
VSDMSGQKIETITITDELAGLRVDKAVSLAISGLSRSAAAKLIEEGNITAAGRPCSKNDRLRAGDLLEVVIPAPRPLEIGAEDTPLDVLYEDDDLLVVNKPQGMVVHPAAGNYCGTLVNALLGRCGSSLSGINGVARPGIVHRIDKDTSGLLLVAKNDSSHRKLAEQLKEHRIKRVYEALVHGTVKKDFGTVDAPIGRHPSERKKMSVTARNSRQAVTHFEVVARYKGFTHLRLTLETGRTHQIRVHMAYIGHPVAGDRVYGPKKPAAGLNGQCLHAGVLGFVHPASGEYMEFHSGLPEYFSKFIKKLESIY